MKRFFSFLPSVLAAACVATMMSCADKGPHLSTEVKFTANLSSANEIPLVSGSSASGKFDGVYNKDTKVMTYTISFTGMSGNPTAAHFHNANRYENGPVAVALAAASGSSISGSATLTQKQENELFVERYYVNVHSAKFPSGEMRGQVEYADYTNR